MEFLTFTGVCRYRRRRRILGPYSVQSVGAV